ncbi:MAG: TonB-dependent receptor plug domain-containing protein [Flavobacteriaceae bacterium]
MPRKHLNSVVLISIFFLSVITTGWGQDSQANGQVSLITYIQELQTQYDVKFSYLDEDLEPLTIQVSGEKELDKILKEIENQTQLIIKKLSDRYYTLSKSVLVDICARILDNFENNTLGGASIEVLGSSITTITNAEGKFSLGRIPRKAVVRIRHIGYKTKYITAEEIVSSDPCTSLLMALSYQELEEVVITQFLTTGISKQTDGSIQINSDEFGILPGQIEPDVLQTVQALPGIKSIDETVSDINIRGGTNDQNLILWDGIKMYQSGHFFGLISAFNPYLTDRVSIIKNGTSAQYGDGVSGVIIMETKDDIDPQFNGGAGFNLISGDIYGQIPITERLAVQVSGRRSTTDFFNTPTYRVFSDRAFQDTQIKVANANSTRIRQDENFYFYDFTAKLLYDLNDYHQFRLSFININNRLDYTEINQDNSQINESSLDQANLSYGGWWNARWLDNFSSSVNAYYTRYNLDSRNITAFGQQVLDQVNEVLETSVKLNTDLRLFQGLHWFNGYQFSEVGITNFTEVSQPPFQSDIKGVIRSHSAFSEIDYASANKDLRLRFGGRFNYLENLDTFSEIVLEPRLNFSYQLAPGLTLEALGEFKNQVTNQIIDLEQNFLGIEKRRWILSDEESLPITRSKQGSLGLSYDKRNWFLSLEGFYKRVDGISTSTQGFQNQNQFNGEIGRYDVKGAEFLINHKNNSFSTWLSYTYNLNDYTFEDIIPPTFPNNLDIRHTLTLGGTYTYHNLKLGLGFNYRTGKPFTEPLPDPDGIDSSTLPATIVYQSPNSGRLPDYIRADASALYRFDLSPRVKATAGLSLLNIFSRENILNVYYRLNNQLEIERVESISLGFTPNVSFRISF